MNLCVFMGNITRKPELKLVGAKQTPVTNFSIAISRPYTKANGESEKDVVFINLEAWDTGAETICRHFDKGSPIIVHCSAKENNYKDKEGKDRVGIKFRVDRFFFVPRTKDKKESNEEENSEENDNPDHVTDGEIPF